MLFSSVIFMFLFLPVVLAGYFLTPYKLKNTFLLCASLFFYAWGEEFYAIIMVISIVANYIFGLLLDRFNQTQHKKWILALGVTVNLSLLFVYKYLNFIIHNFNDGLEIMNWPLIKPIHDHLPIGISFFTFQSISYLVDLYRKQVSVQSNLINMGLYISLFPQLIAGPIVRYHDIAKQLTKRHINFEHMTQGVQRFIIGLAKKVLIANTLALPADQIFGLQAADLTLGLSWLGTICYTLQIYFDFSGYSDMAIGLGKMFGFDFLENFNYPYISQSIKEFWRRWHISLSSWFRDYLYIPMGGGRGSSLKVYRNLIIVFFLCGLWHGASWTFVIWGLYHGVFLILERLESISRFMSRLPGVIKRIYMLIVVMGGWVLFRAENFTQALAFYQAGLGMGQGDGLRYNAAFYLEPHVIIALVLGIIAATPVVFRLKQLEQYSSVVLIRSFVLLTILLVSLSFMASGTYNPFIYFRF